MGASQNPDQCNLISISNANTTLHSTNCNLHSAIFYTMFGNLGHFGAKAQQCGSMGGLNRQMTQITYVKDIILDQEW